MGYGPWGCTESNVTERRTLVEEPDTTAHARTHTHTHVESKIWHKRPYLKKQQQTQT